MAHQIINKLIDYYSRNFFIEPILLLAFIFSCVIGLLYNYRQKERILFVIYFFAGASLFLLASPAEVVLTLAGRKVDVFNEACNTTFEIAEFTALQYFFKKCLRNQKFKKVSSIFFVFFATICLIFFAALSFPGYPKEAIREHSFLINVLEFLLLAFLCLAYFYELFTEVPKINLFERPSFFITTSVFFYSVLLIPFFIIARALSKDEQSIFFVLFSCHYLLLIIVLIAVSKAFLCTKSITT
jgi:hypothetical protein